MAAGSAAAFTNNPTLQASQSAGTGAINALAASLGLGGAGGGFSASGYLSANPDVAQAAQGLTDEQRKYLVNQGYPATAEGFAQYHYDRYGSAEGRPTGAQSGGANPAQSAFDQYLNSVGAQTALREGSQAITGNRAAAGLLGSGSTGKELIRFGQNETQKYYQNYLNNLLNLSGQGQNAALSTAGAQQNATLSAAGIEATRGGIGSKIGGAIGAVAGLNPFGIGSKIFK